MSNEQVCIYCGAAMAEGDRFCQSCGTALAINPRLSGETSVAGTLEFQTVELAGFWRRVGAYLIDFAVLWLAIRILRLTPFWALPHLLFSLLSYTLLLGYFPYFWKTSGQTPGKRLLGLRVVRTSGHKLSLGRAILRLVGYLLSTLALNLGYLWIVFDRKK